MSKYSSKDEIQSKLSSWQETQKYPIQPMSEERAIAVLTNPHNKMSREEIQEKTAQITVNGGPGEARFLASYPDLQGLDHVDRARSVELENSDARTMRAILQAAEIAMLNTSDLTKRATADVKAGKIGDAEEKYRWVSSLQETLYSLEVMASNLPSHGKGTEVSIAHSPHTRACLDDLEKLHKALIDNGSCTPRKIGYQNLFDPEANLRFQANVDTTYTSLWKEMAINLPGIERADAESEQDFYRRVIGTDALNLAVNELDQTGDNFLRQFRAYHQMSEILVRQANQLIGDATTHLLDEENGNLLQAKADMCTALTLLKVVDKNLSPILRHLSVNKYQDIRSSLGVTSGSFSPNIRKGLFETLYPLYVEAVKYRVAGAEFTDDAVLQEKLTHVVENHMQDYAANTQYELIDLFHN